MGSVLFEEHTGVTAVTVPGSQAAIETGLGATARNPEACNAGWFVGATTVILGGGGHGTPPTTARWEILVDPGAIRHCQAGYLVICCERAHGGLHTLRYGATAEVCLNGRNRDLIGLKDVPAGHTDYFHRPPTPLAIPEAWPSSGCATVYSWPIDRRHLSDTGTQTVTVRLEKDISWDIDYVSVLLVHTSRKLRDPYKQIAYIVLGALLGAVATVLLSG